MRSVEGVLGEEFKRLAQAQRSYRREIRGLPKGSIQMKRIKGIVYPYLALRKGRKVVYRYLGAFPKEELGRLDRSIELRRRYERLLSEVRKNRARLARMLRGKRRSV